MMRFPAARNSPLKTAIIVAICLFAGGCISGDPIISYEIDISFPEASKEQVVPLILDVGRARSYQRSGRWEVDGLPRHSVCIGDMDIDACVRKFMANARWSERDLEITQNAIRFSFIILRPDRIIELGPEVAITDWEKGSQAKIEFLSFAHSPSPALTTEFHALKRLLVERYGPMVRTRKEP